MPSGSLGALASEGRIVVGDKLFAWRTVWASTRQSLTVTFVNEGKNVHEVEIEELAEGTKLQPGESRGFTVKLEQQTYGIYRAIHEDREAGGIQRRVMMAGVREGADP